MRSNIFIFIILLLSFTIKLECQNGDSILYDLDIEEVTIKRKPALIINEIGPSKSNVDSLALRKNITVNLAELLSGIGPVFVKSYGRSTLATASFRGTSPNHTLVTWNGMKINSPMLGMVDLSTIPSFFIDKMEVSSGPSTIDVASGGLGGAIEIKTEPDEDINGYNLQYVQGISSYNTYDQYLDLSYGKQRIRGSSKLYYSSSKNNFPYTNYRKKIFIFDETGNITDSYYPVEKNKNGFFNDLHALQELYFDSNDGSKWSAIVWIMGSRRGIPMLNVDYRTTNLSENRQDEITVRSVVSWVKEQENRHLSVKWGYIHTNLGYEYLGDTGNGYLKKMVDSNSLINTLFISGDSEFIPNDNLSVSVSVSLYQHFVKSIDNAFIDFVDDSHIIGYNKARFEPSALMTVRYKPLNRLGLTFTLREDIYGGDIIPPVPAIFADFLLSQKWNIKLKSSFARNYRFPTLNDLYFRPGGNSELKAEKGLSYDFSISFDIENSIVSLNGDLSFFGSKINDWILWLPNYKGYWSPLNISQVDSQGMETSTDLIINLPEERSISFEGNFAITRSINRGDPIGFMDQSIGKQLVYIPVYSSSIKGIFESNGWKFLYSWNYYSKRYTTSSNNDDTNIGVLGDYFMNDISIEKKVNSKIGSFSYKIMINNLFNEEYESVLSRPMPRRNYGLFLSYTPKMKMH